jgi:hypothetical protein
MVGTFGGRATYYKDSRLIKIVGIHSGAKRQEFFDTGFGLMASMAYPDADLEHLRPSMDFILWLFAVSTLLS